MKGVWVLSITKVTTAKVNGAPWTEPCVLGTYTTSKEARGEADFFLRGPNGSHVEEMRVEQFPLNQRRWSNRIAQVVVEPDHVYQWTRQLGQWMTDRDELPDFVPAALEAIADDVDHHRARLEVRTQPCEGQSAVADEHYRMGVTVMETATRHFKLAAAHVREKERRR